MMNNILKGWGIIRILKMGLGIAGAVQGIVMKDVFSGVIGAALILSALFNVGCSSSGSCCGGSCNVPKNR